MRRWVSCFLVSEVKSVSEGAVCFGFLFILLRLKQHKRRAVCHAISFKLHRNGKKNGKRFYHVIMPVVIFFHRSIIYTCLLLHSGGVCWSTSRRPAVMGHCVFCNDSFKMSSIKGSDTKEKNLVIAIFI